MTARYSCEVCSSPKNVLFCRECTHVSCKKCMKTTQVVDWQCNICNKFTNGEYCGTCGNESQIADQRHIPSCPNCSSTSLGDPTALLGNLNSDFYSIISKVTDVIPEINDLHRKFDFFVTLVRLCRLAGLTGFPQIETQLEKCGTGLNGISERGINQLNQVRKEVLYSIRSVNYFQDIELDHYRNAESVINSTQQSVQQIYQLLRYWIDEVDKELEKLVLLAKPLRQHYDLLTTVTRFLPNGVYNVAAIIPPTGMDIQSKKRKRKSESYIVFADEEFICLPREAVENSRKVIPAFNFSYHDIVKISEKHSLLRGDQLIIGLSEGHVKINGPPMVNSSIRDYFELVQSGQPFTVGSAKDIISIESNGPDKNKYKRATSKFIETIRDKLFGSPVQEYSPKEVRFSSMRELKHEFNRLEKSAQEIDYLAKNLQIDPEVYRQQRNSIKDALHSIRSSIGQMGGHVARRRLDQDDFNFGNSNSFGNL